ncbi:MAG TPA: thymidine phosphorylase [Polyangiaceae bacterium]|jgi:pyrimidine-nucleoside phosphorylase|nr:thymidine phosphorylase [Polyangiaceae bacterium]
MKGPFNPVEMIRSKRDGGSHSAEQIADFIAQFSAGTVADYQMSAWLMAVFARGMSDRETVALTHAMLHSGKVLRLASVKGAKVDKHSTGGVGDKISICLAPLVAACGVSVPMISGRGLGHTGGTLDKLQAIPGYRVELSPARFERVVREVGASMIGQSAELAPADRRIYALRDVTATVECIPLIVASILSKKLAEGIDGLVLDVKVGQGAFMKDVKSARALAQALVRVGSAAGKRVVALLTAMDFPIGRSIGNGLETREAIEVLRNAGPTDTRELTLTLGVEMLLLGKAARSSKDARARLERALADGSALERFARMVKAHGGDVRVVERPQQLAKAKAKVAVLARRSGYVSECDAYALGMSALRLGAGRTRADQAVDPSAGIELCAQRGERIARGEPLAMIHARTKPLAESEAERIQQAFGIANTKPRAKHVVLERIAH